MSNRIPDSVARTHMIERGITPDPDVPYPGTATKWPGTCQECGGSTTACYYSVVRMGQGGCRPCGTRKAHDLQRIPDHVARPRMIACGITPDPDIPFPGSGKHWPGTCQECGRPTTAGYNKVVNKGQGGCSPCAARKRGDAARHPDAVARAAMIARGVTPDPDIPFPGSAANWPGTCQVCDGPTISSYGSVVNRGQGGCSFCGTRKGADAIRIPDAIARAEMIAHGITPNPDILYPGNIVPWPGTCQECGSPTISNYNKVVNSGQCGCRPCGIRKYADTQRIPDAVARAAMIARGITPNPDIPFQNANAPWPGTCQKCDGSTVSSYTAVVTTGQGGCRPCGHRKLADMFRLPDAVARAAMIAYGITPDPSIPYQGSQANWPGTCQKCGQPTIAGYGNVVTAGQGGCSSCANYGFDSNAPSFIYLLIRENAIKVGVFNVGAPRLVQHGRRGWVTLHTWSTATGRGALDIEGAVLRSWRAAHIPYATNVPKDGYTETAPLSMVNLDATIALIESLIAEKMVA